jgi:hypothetical protein
LVKLLVKVLVPFLGYLKDVVEFGKTGDKGLKIFVCWFVVDSSYPVKEAPGRIEAGEETLVPLGIEEEV